MPYNGSHPIRMVNHPPLYRPYHFHRPYSRPYLNDPNPPRKTPPKKFNLPNEVAEIILAYVKIDNNYGCNMRNFALVEASWRLPATRMLYTNLIFESYKDIFNYLDKIHHPEYARYASTARSICLSRLSGPPNAESVLCYLVQSCPNIESFKIYKCPPTWVTDLVLSAMGAHWPRLVKLSLHCRNRRYGKAFLTAIKRWPGLTYLDLNNVSGLDEQQYHEIIGHLPNLRFLRLSRQINEQSIPDHMTKGLLRAITNTCRFLKIIELNNCTRLSNVPLLNCFRTIANTLECIVITGCMSISGITLAEVIAACSSLRFVNVSRSVFNDNALRYLSGTDRSPEVAPRVCKSIERFAMSSCPYISLPQFRLFANVLGSCVQDGHVKKCIMYSKHMKRDLDEYIVRDIEYLNPGLIIDKVHEGFIIDEII